MANLKGKQVVFTGTLIHSTRAEAEAHAKKIGMVAGSKVTEKTDLLVAGTKAGSKLKAAKKCGVKVIDEAEWVRISECAVKSKVVKPKGLIPVKDHSEKVSKANKKYCFRVQIRIVDENYESEFVYFKKEIKANDVNSLAKIVRPNWKKAKTRAKTRGKGENKWCFIDCEEVIRCADGTSYFDDNLIPQGPDVAEQLLEILDV